MDDSLLKRRVRAFYDQYHKERLRSPDQKQLRRVWSFFSGRTLEVGAGRWLWDCPLSTQYVVVDLSTEAVARALDAGVKGIVGDGETLSFADHEFETVACHDVLEHVVNPAALLSEMCRVSRKRVLVAGPNYVGHRLSAGFGRQLASQSLEWLAGPGRGCYRMPNPHLAFDEEWAPDADAVTAANAWWVGRELSRNGMRVAVAETWIQELGGLNLFPVFRYLGPFMIVMGVRGG